jgi:CelD/BcsL family acetyltransferase involved in cellulose biosynthesis
MEIKLISDFDEISEQDWNALVQKNSTNTPFQLYGYLKNWWKYKGGGEWNDGELLIICGYHEDSLVGIAPLFRTIHEGKNSILLLGSIEISDYLDFIYDPEHGPEFVTQTLTFLAENNPDSFERILLVNLPESFPTISLLNETCRKLGWKMESENAYHTPAIQLADDWDAYLAGIDKKQRHEIRRKMRRAKEGQQAVSWHQTNDPELLEAETEDFFNLMTTDPEKQQFLTEKMRVQIKNIIEWAYDADLLQLSFLNVGDQKAAGYLCFDYQDRIWVYNSGFDPQFRDYSPGWVMLGYLIQNAIENGKKVFDFMRGDETYKYRFGATDSFVLKVEISK